VAPGEIKISLDTTTGSGLIAGKLGEKMKRKGYLVKSSRGQIIDLLQD
jgi:lactate dehydrogenase-like 2-hydroxyacid dehydrogenase